jgi:hypothetical protein
VPRAGRAQSLQFGKATIDRRDVGSFAENKGARKISPRDRLGLFWIDGYIESHGGGEGIALGTAGLTYAIFVDDGAERFVFNKLAVDRRLFGAIQSGTRGRFIFYSGWDEPCLAGWTDGGKALNFSESTYRVQYESKSIHNRISWLLKNGPYTKKPLANPLFGDLAG